jgi:hypothetical protein
MSKAQSTARRATKPGRKRDPLKAYRHKLSDTGSALAATVMRAEAARNQIFDHMTTLEEKISDARNMAEVLLTLGQPNTDQARMFSHFGSVLQENAEIAREAFNKLRDLLTSR